MDSDTKYIIIGSLCFFVVLLGFGISEIVIYTDGKETTPYTQSCGSFPGNLTSFSMTKQILSQWHWQYQFDEFSGRVEQMCPSLSHDAAIYIDGARVAFTDKKVFSTVSTTYINNCHGDTIYVARTGSLFDTIINGNSIAVSFELRDSSGDTVVAYVQGIYFFNDDIDVRDTNGTIVAHMSRPISDLSLEWDVTIYDPTSPGADARVIALLSAQKSFSENSNSTDICNNYFYGVAWTFLAIGILLFLGLCFVIYCYFTMLRNWCNDRHLCDWCDNCCCTCCYSKQNTSSSSDNAFS